MKNILLIKILLILFFILPNVAKTNAQKNCPVVRDSIIAGSGAGGYSNYLYDAKNRISQVNYFDSQNVLTKYIMLTYNEAGQLAKAEFYKSTALRITREIKYSYKAGKAIRVDVADNMVDGGKISHDVAYDKAGNIRSIIVDTASVSGYLEEEVFDASITDIVWQGGNPVSFKMMMGSDVLLNIIATYDGKNNAGKNLFNPEGAIGLLVTAMTNNIMQLTLAEGSFAMGKPVAAGSVLVDNSYTYNDIGEVETTTKHPSLFDSVYQTSLYARDCELIKHPRAISPVLNIKTDPAGKTITLGEDKYFSGVVKLYNAEGNEVDHYSFKDRVSSLDISKLEPGMYHVLMFNVKQTYRGTLEKNKSQGK